MTQNRVTWVDRTLILAPCYIGLCLSEDAFNKELKRLKLKDPPAWVSESADATTHQFQDSKHNDCIIVCLNANRKAFSYEQVMALLVHEAVHIWQNIKEIINEPIPSHEFEAYAIQGISQELICAYRDMKKKGKK